MTTWTCYGKCIWQHNRISLTIKVNETIRQTEAWKVTNCNKSYFSFFNILIWAETDFQWCHSPLSTQLWYYYYIWAPTHSIFNYHAVHYPTYHTICFPLDERNLWIIKLIQQYALQERFHFCWAKQTTWINLTRHYDSDFTHILEHLLQQQLQTSVIPESSPIWTSSVWCHAKRAQIIFPFSFLIAIQIPEDSSTIILDPTIRFHCPFHICRSLSFSFSHVYILFLKIHMHVVHSDKLLS